MNKYLRRLIDAGERHSRLVIGLMSGTSLDGLDIALCRVSGWGLTTDVKVISFKTFAYQDDFKADIKSIFSRREVDLERLTLLNAKIGKVHGDLILEALREWQVDPDDVDFIASHGQTIYHAPRRLHGLEGYPNATLQIGDADHIAASTGIITIADFRQKHIAAGGEGAPLALYGDQILFSHPTESRVLLNIGGISNLTYLPPSNSSAVVCSDLGPGNTLIDNLARSSFGVPFDDGGRIARSGTVQSELLDRLLDDRFFKEDFPKSTGPELFNLEYLNKALERLNKSVIQPKDMLCTVTHFSARAIAFGIQAIVKDDSFSVYISGGGVHNTYLCECLMELLPQGDIRDMKSLGIGPDEKEAVLFAVLANETVCGSAIKTMAGPEVMMGKLSFPA